MSLAWTEALIVYLPSACLWWSLVWSGLAIINYFFSCDGKEKIDELFNLNKFSTSKNVIIARQRFDYDNKAYLKSFPFRSVTLLQDNYCALNDRKYLCVGFLIVTRKIILHTGFYSSHISSHFEKSSKNIVLCIDEDSIITLKLSKEAFLKISVRSDYSEPNRKLQQCPKQTDRPLLFLGLTQFLMKRRF